MNKTEQNKSSTAQGTSGGEQREPIVDQAKHALTSVAGQAREQVTQQIDARKDRAIEKISDAAGAIRDTSEKLDGIGPLGDVAGRAADGIESLAKYFEGKQLTDVVRDVERFARREPAMFLGAAFAVGLIGGRFLKSSANRNSGASFESGGTSFGTSRGLRDDAWAAGDDGYLSPDDVEDYESRRFGMDGFSSGMNFRNTVPMGSRGTQGTSGVGSSRFGASGGSSSGMSAASGSVNQSSSFTSSPRSENEGPAIAPSPIVNAASANESKTAPMPATQGSAGASASTSTPSSSSTPFSSGSGNGSTGGL